ncbi:unnamed protein product (macronuclear) [Paramecium tetraurelia]|uniref:GPN-loop GTPase 3 n=1 Tax=Paramecium tetraurelia TaxID=5888 RepID=A0CHA4_PARTE|nr:uncharacterized protein GSPATT00007611001 [Paramecium tetraurelia]CAK70171.1 unnamed protein product [Paramecium tetraurelia]|eukprot:XP_001437568.1 hypothetical protein (macronuclear) [Paramecium tetraurelia strain d4-2]
MFYYGQLVIGPAGSGKTSYCNILQEGSFKRNIQVVNLDPAAEYIPYKCAIDIRELICLSDVMEEFEYGPNGGLVYCMEYLLQNWDWMQDQLNNIAQDDYVLFDCPGQIELYSHIDMMRKLTQLLVNSGFSISSVYLVDINFIEDDAKFLSGLLMALSASMTLELPAFTVLSKCDLMKDKKKLKRYTKLHKFNEESEYINQDEFSKTYKSFTSGISELVTSFGIGRLLCLDTTDDESIDNILGEIDYAIQFGDNLEPDDKLYDQAEQQL